MLQPFCPLGTDRVSCCVGLRVSVDMMASQSLCWLNYERCSFCCGLTQRPWNAVFRQLQRYELSTRCRACLVWGCLNTANFKFVVICWLDSRWLSWLRHCATSRKVAGSIPDDVITIFHWHNPSGLTMALGSTQSLTEMSTRNISWGVKAGGS